MKQPRLLVLLTLGWTGLGCSSATRVEHDADVDVDVDREIPDEPSRCYPSTVEVESVLHARDGSFFVILEATRELIIGEDAHSEDVNFGDERLTRVMAFDP